MPKQKQYEDALGSVFDFIFTESQKPPDKRKPVKLQVLMVPVSILMH